PDGCIVIGQTLQPEQILSVRGNWWYLAPRNGHVSTYTEEALEHLGREYGLLFYPSYNEFAFAGPSAGRFARVILASMRPSFSSLRLFAPMALEDGAIVSPDRQRVAWHRAEMLGSRKVRWTGSYQRLQWQAKWSPVSQLRVQIPVAE